MTLYEQVYLFTENKLLLGDIFSDLLTVMFAVIVAGFVLGPRMSRGLLAIVLILYSGMMVPMIGSLFTTSQTVRLMAEGFPVSGADLAWLKALQTAPTPINVEWVVTSLFLLAYIASIYFILLARKQQLNEKT